MSTPVDPIVVAVIAGDHVKVLSLVPAGISVNREVKLPTAPSDVRWLDREHIVAVDTAGQAYLITGDSVATYKMPPAKAWAVKTGTGERGSFPLRLTLARTSAGVELASCATYYQGDDDPCETWAVASLGTSLDVGAITTQSGPPEDEDPVEPELTTSAAEPAFEWKDDADGFHTNVALHLGTARREWNAPEPCPFTDASIKWLSQSPPIIAFLTTTDCGEGGPNVEQHLLRMPALADFTADGLTLVLSPVLWAYGGESGWTLQSGDRVVGSLDSRPIMPPVNPPAAPVVVAVKPDSTVDRLALRRGEKLRSPSIEAAWKTPSGTIRVTVVDVSYKQTTKRPPITKLVVWGNGKRYDIVRVKRACDAFAEVRLANDKVVFRCGSTPLGDAPEGTIEDWLIRWSEEKKAPLRNKHWTGDPAATEPAWAQDTRASKSR